MRLLAGIILGLFLGGAASSAPVDPNWLRCQSLLLAASNHTDASVLEDTIIETYRSILFDVGNAMLIDGDLRRMIETGDFFSLLDSGSSSRDHLVTALRQLREVVEAHSLNKKPLFQRLAKLVRGELASRLGSAEITAHQREFQAVVKYPKPYRILLPRRRDRAVPVMSTAFRAISLDTKVLVERVAKESEESGSHLCFTDIETGHDIPLPLELPSVYVTALSSDHRLMGIIFENGDVRVLELDGLRFSEVVGNIKLNQLGFAYLWFSQDESLLSIWAGNPKSNRTATIDWRLRQQASDPLNLDEELAKNLLAISPNGKKLVYTREVKTSWLSRVFRSQPQKQREMIMLDRSNPTAPTQNVFGELSDPEMTDKFAHVLFSPDASLLVISSSGWRKTEVWRASPSLEKIGEIPSAAGWLRAGYQFSPDGRFIIDVLTGDVFEASTQKQVLVDNSNDPNNPVTYAFSGDSQVFARRAPGGMIEIYNAQTWSFDFGIKDSSAKGKIIFDYGFLTLSHDGKMLGAQAFENGSIVLNVFDLSDYRKHFNP